MIKVYRCPDCGRKVEIRVKSMDDVQPPCCSCGTWMERVLTPAAIHVSAGTPKYH